jgi:rubrerythrin
MSDDVKLCVEILEKAIAFEEEGIRFFSDRAENAPPGLEKNVFAALAKDEVGHKEYLSGLRQELLRTRDVESLPDETHEQKSAREIFETALASVKDKKGGDAAQLDILRGAMEVEKKGYRIYSQAAADVQSPKAKELFLHLAAEEQTHYQLLHNSLVYMSDPETWHEFDEGPILDGG